jgi:hypothetical protein
MHNRKSLRHAFSCLAILTAGVAMSACTATVTATPVEPTVIYDYPVVAVHTPPPGIHEHPSVVYHGRPAYLVGTRWYYPSEHGWVYFREEPDELRQRRVAREYTRVDPQQSRHRYPAAPTETGRRRYD